MFRRLFLILFLGSLSFACTSEPLGQPCTIAGKEVGPGESIIKAMTCESCRCDEAGPPVCEAIPDCRPTIPDIEDRSGTNEGDDYDPDRDGPRPRDPDRTDEDCASGGLSGTACAPDGTSIAGAVVRARGMDCHGMEILRETQEASVCFR